MTNTGVWGASHGLRMQRSANSITSIGNHRFKATFLSKAKFLMCKETQIHWKGNTETNKQTKKKVLHCQSWRLCCKNTPTLLITLAVKRSVLRWCCSISLPFTGVKSKGAKLLRFSGKSLLNLQQTKTLNCSHYREKLCSVQQNLQRSFFL